MKEIFIRNIFVDIFLTWYFKYAYNISYSIMHTQGRNQYIDERTMSRVFQSINSKIQHVNMHRSKECSFLNLSGLLNLPIKEVYPVKFYLTSEELFWFELIINLSADELLKHVENCKNVQQLRRLYSIPSDYKEEFLSIFNNTKAIDLVRTRFIQGERIGNEATRTGFYIDSKTGVAYRI